MVAVVSWLMKQTLDVGFAVLFWVSEVDVEVK